MIKDSEKVEPLSIKDITPLRKINFPNQEIDLIKKSLHSIRSIPLIVIPKPNSKKFQLCSNPEIFEALVQLKIDPIDCVVRRGIGEQEGKEILLSSILPHIKLSSIEYETLVWEIYQSGNYESHAEFARRIGKSDKWVIDRCNAKLQREKYRPDVPSDIASTETLTLIHSLPIKEQELFLFRIDDGKIKVREVRECAKFLKDEKVPDGLRQSVLTGDIRWRQAKRFWDARQPGIKAITDAMKEYHNKVTIQKIIENEQPNYTSEPYRLLGEFTNTITVDSVKNIKDKIQIEQVKRYLRIAGTQIFQLLHDLDVIDEKQYKQICTISKIPQNQVKKLKEDGKYYFFEDSLLTDNEKKLKERINKILNGTQEPLLR